MNKTIVGRLNIGGELVGKVTYETRKDSFHGKQLARLVLDEFVGFTKNVAYDGNGKAEPWVVTFTDGDSELAFTSLTDSLNVGVEMDGERVDMVENAYSTERTEIMWRWLYKEGWR